MTSEEIQQINETLELYTRFRGPGEQENRVVGDLVEKAHQLLEEKKFPNARSLLSSILEGEDDDFFREIVGDIQSISHVNLSLVSAEELEPLLLTDNIRTIKVARKKKRRRIRAFTPLNDTVIGRGSIK